MTRPRTAKATYDAIDRLAREAFANHKIAVRGLRQGKADTFICRNPSNGFHWFGVHVEPSAVFVWGDLGEFVLRCSDSDALKWLLADDSNFTGNRTDGSRVNDFGGAYCDYTLGKCRSADGDRKEFMIDDARDFLDSWEADIRAELGGPTCEAALGVHHIALGGDPVLCGQPATGTTENGERVCAECTARLRNEEFTVDDDDRTSVDKHLEQVAEAREALADHEYDHPSEQKRAWFEVMRDVGYDDPPDCEGWAPQMLWLWQAIKTFRRLHHAEFSLESAMAASDKPATIE